ncbi:hypothetical protein HanRHA438_Chr16g0770941 [Helianthus annuus]|nr:hypothetical protein HanRHA438_Chr16g0770941 [Helianthus annuus]
MYDWDDGVEMHPWLLDGIKRNIWVKRFKQFRCKKHESLDQLKERYYELLSRIRPYMVRMSDAC